MNSLAKCGGTGWAGMGKGRGKACLDGLRSARTPHSPVDRPSFRPVAWLSAILWRKLSHAPQNYLASCCLLPLKEESARGNYGRSPPPRSLQTAAPGACCCKESGYCAALLSGSVALRKRRTRMYSHPPDSLTFLPRMGYLLAIHSSLLQPLFTYFASRGCFHFLASPYPFGLSPPHIIVVTRIINSRLAILAT